MARPRPQRALRTPTEGLETGGALRGAYDVYCDGEKVEHVVAYDMGKGTVDVLCMHGHTGYGGRSHWKPWDPNERCTVRRAGRVEVKRRGT